MPKKKVPRPSRRLKKSRRAVQLFVDPVEMQKTLDEYDGAHGLEILVTLADDGVVVDVLDPDGENAGSTWKTYGEIGLDVTICEIEGIDAMCAEPNYEGDTVAKSSE